MPKPKRRPSRDSRTKVRAHDLADEFKKEHPSRRPRGNIVLVSDNRAKKDAKNNRWPKLRLQWTFDQSNVDIWHLVAKIHPSPHAAKKPVVLSVGERKVIAKILFRILDKEDPREDFYEILNHRPQDPVIAAAKFEACYEVLLDKRFGVPPSAAKEAACQRWGLNQNQLKHALKEFRNEHGSYVEDMSTGQARAEWEFTKERDPREVLFDATEAPTGTLCTAQQHVENIQSIGVNRYFKGGK